MVSHINQVQEEKRLFDILYSATERMARTFGYEEIEEKSTEVVSDQEDKNQDPKQNPNCDAYSPSLRSGESNRPRLDVSNKTVRRRREAVSEREVVRERRTPEWLVNVMREENGVDAKLIFEKELEESDLERKLARLLIPFNKMKDMNFLNEDELKIIDEHVNKIRTKGVNVTLVDSRGEQWNLNLRRWNMGTSSYYALVTGWNDVVLDNRLKIHQKLHAWSFHSPSGLFIAFVPPDPAPSLPPAPVLTDDYEEPSTSQTDAQEKNDRIFQVPAPAPDRGLEGLNLLDQVCVGGREAVQEPNRRSSLDSVTMLDLELRL